MSGGTGVAEPPEMGLVTLVKEGSGRGEISLQAEQVTPSAVARIFSVSHLNDSLLVITVPLYMQLNLDSIWLRERDGPSVFFPDGTNSRFDFTADVGYIVTTLYVEGSTSEGRGASSSSAGLVSSVCPGGATNRPFTSPNSIAHHGNKKTHISLKILQANIVPKRGASNSSRPEFRVIGQDFFDITEYTANVVYLNHAVRERWGADYVLVTSDGMKIQDSSGTQG